MGRAASAKEAAIVTTPEQKCDRCGLAAHDTPEGFLAYHGARLVCSDCDSDLNNEWVADHGGVHPLDALNPIAKLFAK
jgi:ribosomal protein S27AE